MELSLADIKHKLPVSHASTQQHASINNQVNRRAALPSVLAPNPLPSMDYPTASSHLLKILGQDNNIALPLLERRVTIVHYDVNGAPIISPHLPGIDDFTLTSEYTLQLLVLHIQNVLDKKLDIMEGRDQGKVRSTSGSAASDITTKDTLDEKGKLLVTSIEIRGGREKFFKEFPGILGDVVWAGRWKDQASGSENPNMNYDGRQAERVVWDNADGGLRIYWEYYRMMMMKGIMLQVDRPILKVRTVRRVATEGPGLIAGGHTFTRSRLPDKKNRVENLKKSEKKTAPAQIEEPLHRNIPDLSSLGAPEFQVAMLFQEALKHNPNAELQSVYNLHIQRGGEPMKELVFKVKDGGDKEATWVKPDGLRDSEAGSDDETVQPNESPQKLAEVHSTLRLPYDPELRAKLAEAHEAAVGFDQKDDHTFFSTERRPVAARPENRFQPRPRQITLINLFRNRVYETIENHSGGGSLNNDDNGTPGISDWCSPSGLGYPSTTDTPTPSARLNIAPLTSLTPALSLGNKIEPRHSSPLGRVAANSQLRPESPVFKFPVEKGISENNLARLNLGPLELFNGNKLLDAAGSGPGSDNGYRTPQTGLMPMFAAHSALQGAQNGQGTGFGTMTQAPTAASETNVNFQASLLNQTTTMVENTGVRVSPYPIYHDPRPGPGVGFNPNIIHSPFIFRGSSYGGYVGASPNTVMGRNHMTGMNFGAGGYTFDFSDPLSSAFNNANFTNGFDGST